MVAKNTGIERLWKSAKYENIYLNVEESGVDMQRIERLFRVLQPHHTPNNKNKK